MSRVPSPPPPGDMSTGPVAESWCYTQVGVPVSDRLSARLSPVSLPASVWMCARCLPMAEI